MKSPPQPSATRPSRRWVLRPDAGPQLRPWALLAIAVIAISSSAILVRFTDASSLTLSWWRTLGGSLVLAPAALRSWRSASTERPPPTRHAVALLALAGVGLGAHFWTWLASLERTSVAASVALVSTAPFFVAALASAGWADRDRHRTSWTAVLAAVAGAVLIGFSGDSAGTSQHHLSGSALALAGAAAMAVYLVIGERLRGPGQMATAAYAGPVYLTAAAALTVAVAVTATNPFDLNGRDVLVVVAMIAGPQLCGHTVLNHLLVRFGALSIAVVLLAEPVGATVLAWLVLGERPAALTLVGAALVMAGLLVRLIATQRTSR